MQRKKAVGLKYDTQKDNAPRVIALGQGEIAEQIILLAKEKGVPILDNPNLVEQLINLELNQEIPQDLYEVVAEVLAFIYKLKNQAE